MKTLLRLLFILPVLLYDCFSACATHIVGGEINYRCLGNNQYEVSLVIFRDCDTGVPWFDNPAAIGVFNMNNVLVYDIRIPLTSQNDTLVPDLSDPCLVAPPNVCIHTTTYMDTIFLPFIPGGYQLVYQRCCRNQDIVNIVNPLNTGATYYSYISEEALLGCNNSAVFREWPPVYICLGYPIVFDHSAIDADGDSIVYSLCDPFTGATPFNPMPQPPFNPPYSSVTWAPGFGINDMLGNPTAPLSIHPQTGLLTGTPGQQGVFVVGVCASEYRNGVLISTTKRDFQYAIGLCGLQVSSAFFAPSVLCDNSLIVSFNNNSDGITNTYQWFFGDPTNPGGTSTLENPVYIYPDTGLYTITLVADPGTICADTSQRQVYLQYESILMDFTVASLACTDSLTLVVTDLSIDTISTIVQWHWNFGNGQQANIPYASTVYTGSGTYIVSLTVEAANGCTATLQDTLTLSLPNISVGDTVAICAGETAVELNPGGDPTHQYQWSPATGLSSATAANPSASPSQTTTYYVTVTAYNGLDTCVLERSVTVVVPPPIQVQLPPDTITCATSLQILATSNTAVQWEWSLSPFFSVIISTQNPLTVNLPLGGSRTFFVRGTDAYGCSAVDTITVTQNNSPIVPNFSYNVINCGAAGYTVQFTDLTTDFSQGAIGQWAWNFGNGASSNQQNPVYTYPQGGSYTVVLTATSVQGCFGSVSQPISFNLPVLTSADTVGICPGQTSIVLNPGGNPAYTYQWAPPAGLSATNVPSPTATIASPTTYTVTVTAFNNGQPCTAVRNVHVLFSPPVTVTSPPWVIYCGNTVTLTASSPTAVSYAWANDPSFNIILSTSNPATFTPQTFPYAGYYVRATNAYGCTATAYTIVERRTTPIQVQFGYQIVQCSNTMTVQFTDQTTDLAGSFITNWQWTASNGQSSTQQNPVFTFNATGTYFVTLSVTLANGCTGTLTQALPLQIASITTGSTVGLCPGNTAVTLNPGGSPLLQYVWSPATGLSATNVPSPVATPPSLPFTYTVTVTGFNAGQPCQQIHNITIINPPPLSLSVPEDTLFCRNPFLLNAVYTNTPGNVLQWATNPQFNPVALTNANPVNVNFGGVPTDFTLYVRLTDPYGCSVSDTVILRYRTGPIAVNFDMSVLGCSDTLSVALSNISADTTHSQPSSWNWTFSNGQSSTAPAPPPVAFTGAGPHLATLTVTLNNGCTGTDTDTLLREVPTLNLSDSTGLCGQASVVLNPGGNPNHLYQWSPPTGLDNPNAASPVASPAQTTVYTVTVTAPNGGDTCRAVRQTTVGPGLTDLQVMNDTILCGVNGIQLTAYAPGIVSIDWALDRNFVLILGQTNPYYTNVNQSRWFYVRGRDAFGCEVRDSVYIQVRHSPINVLFDASPLHCGDSMSVQFTDLTSDTVGNAITSWMWLFGNGQFSTAQNPAHTYLQSGTYTVQLQVMTQNGCAGVAERDLSFLLPQLFMGNSGYLCRGDSVELNPNFLPGLAYAWSPPTALSDPSAPNPLAFPDTTTTYTVSVFGYFSFNGQIDTCTRTDTIRLIVPDTAALSIIGGGVVCGDTLTELAAMIQQAIGYNWSTDNNFNVIIGSDSLISVPVTGQTAWYYLEASDKYGCLTYDSISVVGNRVEIEAEAFPLPCSTEPVRMEVTVLMGNADSLQYVWSPDAGILSGQNTPAAFTNPDADKTFQVVAVNAWGCTDTAWVSVSASGGIPALDVQAVPDTIWAGETVQLSATAYTGGYSYVWSSDPSGWTSGNTPLTSAQPGQPTVFYVTLTDPFGCFNTDSVSVFVRSSLCDEPNIFIPNTFTPNGDGLNDLLFVRGIVISELYFVVYDRWGEQVFETTDPNAGWDGTFRGKALPPDVYGYYMRCVCIGGGEFFKKGNVTLMR